MLISVIVPIYNVEKYLRKCIDSILNQTYSNLEIILVDDGSPDGCSKICDEYALKDKRIIVIHKINGGLSSARNAGLDIAKGDYIAFVDSDDWIEPNMYEEMLSFMQSEQLDLVECGINLISDSKQKLFKQQPNIIITGKEALRKHLDPYGKSNQMLPRVAVWSKLFKRSFWTQNRFPEGQIHEDYLLTCKALYESKKVGLLYRGMLNHVTDNPTSIINSKFSRRDLYKEKQLLFRIEYLKSKHEDGLVHLAETEYYIYLVSVIWICYQNNMYEKNEYIKKIKSDYKYIVNLNIPTKIKIQIRMIYYCPQIFLILRKIYYKLTIFLFN